MNIFIFVINRNNIEMFPVKEKIKLITEHLFVFQIL